MPLGDPCPAFYVGADAHGQRYAYPASDTGRAYFTERIGDFDVSEEGWELDTTSDAFTEFENALNRVGLNWEYDETVMVTP